VIIITALFGLMESVYGLVIKNDLIIGVRGFSVVFGSMMSLLIALEFNHTIFHSVKYKGQIVRVKTVVLIAILSISREYILLDQKDLNGEIIVGYAISLICLGLVYLILDKREGAASEN
jgi:uncharacterized membrane protein (DUF373 family)